MRAKNFCYATKTIFATLITLLLAATVATQPAQAKTQFKVMHTFHGKDGFGPVGALTRDAAGNLYGTTSGGGYQSCGSSNACGTAFELNKNGKQVWLHKFNGKNGLGPEAGLLRDRAGNLYGTTVEGGDLNCEGSSIGCGTVFRLDSTGHENRLYKFRGTPDGYFPEALLVADGAGNLYGTTYLGGSDGFGAVFRVNPSGKETVLYSFTGGSDGCLPYPGVTLDAAGTLYGVAEEGGSGFCNSGDGVVFKLDSGGNFSVLYTFGGSDGRAPDSVLLFDAAGNLYGTTGYGGTNSNNQCTFGCGTVFKLAPDGSETVLYDFCSLSNCVDGAEPGGGPLVRDGRGTLYGTTTEGGQYQHNCNTGSCGVVFELDSAGRETVLHSFSGGADGAFPLSGLAMDSSSGELYGTAAQGGDTNCSFNAEPGCGVVFRIRP